MKLVPVLRRNPASHPLLELALEPAQDNPLLYLRDFLRDKIAVPDDAATE